MISSLDRPHQHPWVPPEAVCFACSRGTCSFLPKESALARFHKTRSNFEHFFHFSRTKKNCKHHEKQRQKLGTKTYVHFSSNVPGELIKTNAAKRIPSGITWPHVVQADGLRPRTHRICGLLAGALRRGQAGGRCVRLLLSRGRHRRTTHGGLAALEGRGCHLLARCVDRTRKELCSWRRGCRR